MFCIDNVSKTVGDCIWKRHCVLRQLCRLKKGCVYTDSFGLNEVLHQDLLKERHVRGTVCWIHTELSNVFLTSIMQGPSESVSAC